MRKLKLFLSLLMLMAFSLGNVWGVDYQLVTSTDDLVVGANYVIGTSDGSFIATTTNNNNRKMTSGTITNNVVTATDAMMVFTLGGTSSGWTLYAGNYAGGAGYLNATSTTGSNNVKIVEELDQYAYFTIAITDAGVATITCTGKTSRNILYKNGTTCFSCYNNQTQAQYVKPGLYKEVSSSCSNTVTITKGAETNGTYSLSATSVCGDGEGGEVSVTDIDPAEGFAFDEITATNGTEDNINKKVTGITENTTITVTFKELQKYTVSFNTGAGNPAQADITETTAGAGITLPAGPTPACSADGWTFAGWAAEAVASETTSAPTLLSGKYNPTDNVTLYAVYKRTEEGGGIAFARYEKVTSNPTDWSGTYLLAANTSGTTYYTFTGMNGATAGASTELTPGTTEQTDYEVVVAKTTNGYSLYHTKGKVYLGLTSDGNNLNSNSSFTASNYEWTLSYDNGVQSVAYTARYIECNTSSSYKVACYKASQKRFYLYKRIEEAASTTYYLSAPSCCTKHNIELVLGIQHGSISADLTEACEGTEVTLTATPDEHCRFVKWDVKQGETPVAVSENKFTMPEGNVTVSATFEEIRNTVNIINPGHGDITVTGADDLDAVLEGTELSVEVSGAGYEFTLKAYKVGDELTTVQITDGKLTMPAYGIVITADEQELVSPTILVSKEVIDFGTAVKGDAAPASETFTISGANLTGDLSLAWESADAYFTWEVTEGSLAANAGIVEATIRVNVTEKGMSVADTHVDNLIVSGGGATKKEVMVGVEVQQTYTAKWFVNGEELTESTQTAVAGTDLIVPTNPTKLADDCDDMSFKGWAEAAIEGKQDNAPTYTTKTQMPEADVNFYAVFAVEKENISKEEYQYTIPVSDFNTTSYAANNNEKTVNAVCTTDESKKLEVKYTSNQVMQSSSLIQGQKSAGYIYNAAAWGSKVKSITINDNENYTYVIGASAQPTVSAEGAFFKISAGSATSKASSIDIVFEVSNKSVSYTDYMTTCQSCAKVNLLKAATEHGAYTFKQNDIEIASVKTCDAAATVDVVFKPELGYELANFQISELEGVSYADGVLTIAQNAAGDLTTTATFAPKNYSVTMAQTGDADATLSENQAGKHIGDEIAISTTLPEGYYFVGWEATPAAVFADAKAPNTTFTMPASDVTVTAKFTKILSIVEAADLIDADHSAKHPNSVVEGYIAGNILYDENYHSITYNIQAIDANGFLSGKTIKVYSGKGLNNTNFDSENGVKVGAKVRVLGELMWYSKEEVYEINYNNYQLIYVEAANPSVVVYGDATKTAYEVGDDFDFTGLSAKTVYDNGYATAIAEPEWTADPETIAANTESVSVTANGSSAKVVNITVNTHAITIETPENGTLVVKNGEEAIASGDAFAKGTVLTVEAIPASADYRLDALTVNGNDIKEAKQFTIVTENYVVAATFAEKAVAELVWSKAEATAVDYEGAVNALPTLTNAASLEVAYESTNTDVAEIAANGDVTIKAAGTATIKAIFAGNETYKAATVTYELTVSHVPVVKLAGTFNDWTGALLTPNEDYTKASVKVNFAADSWPLFKMIVDEEWRGLPKDGDNYYLFHRDWNTVEISGAGDDIQLKADFEGEYTFTWTYATNTLTITFPDMPEPEYYIAGDFTSWETNMAKMTEDAGMYNATVTINATKAQEFKVVRVQGPYKTWYGLAGEATMTPDNCENWIIGGGDKNIGLQPNYAGKYTFYFVPEDMKLSIDMPTEQGTALDNTEAGETAVKGMQNGQLLIIKNGKTYNAQGQIIK